jgi:hypothetical protein
MSQQELPDGKASEKAPDKIEREELVEGGSIRDLSGEYKFQTRHREDTARRLAYSLVGILGGSFVLHYSATLILEFTGRTSSAESLARVFNAWLPVIASLVGGAVTYYFTKEKR